MLALLLFVAPWFLARATATADIDLWASSAAIGIISVAAMLAFTRWEEWANLVLGVWLIVSPWLLGFAHTAAMHFSISIGIGVAFLAMLELWLVYERDDEAITHASTHEQDRALFH